MFKVTCFNCKQSWVLTEEVIETLMASLEEGQNHLNVECPKCRKANKISVNRVNAKRRRK